MRTQILLVLLSVFVSGSTARSQEPLVLVPRVPPAGKPFKVALAHEFLVAQDRSGDSPIQYEWRVTDAATNAPFTDDVGIEGLTEGKISTKLPVLEIKVPKKVRYRFVIRRSNAEEETPESVVEVNAEGEFAQLAGPAEEPTETPAPPAATPATSPAPSAAPAVTPAAPSASDDIWPAPFDVEPGSSQDAILERTGDARDWWNKHVIKQLKQTPIVDEIFIRLKLTEDEKSDFNLKDQMQSPLIAAARFYRAAFAAANAPSGKAEEVWKAERERLIKEIGADDQETDLVVQLVRNFLDALEAEIRIKTKDKPAEFGSALRQAAMIIGKLLLAKVEADTANLGSGPSGGRSSDGDGTTSSGGDGYYGTSHAAVHHARAMSRIRMRNSRRMARIQSYQ